MGPAAAEAKGPGRAKTVRFASTGSHWPSHTLSFGISGSHRATKNLN